MYRQQGPPFGQFFFGGGFGPGQGGFFGGPGLGPNQPPGPPFGGGPGGGPTQPPGPPFGGGGPGGQLPPPPLNPPQSSQGPSLYAVDPGSLRGCLYRYTWIRLENGRSFWFYPTFIGRTSVAGFRWQRRRRRWVYSGFDTNQIASFQCQ
ncbi:hypothetical protein H0266_06705 [Halobacillus locisalis]|uniref:Transporter n=1 Tax=Halobacillus locisalis TaxID=220753 RepID=A0A838CRU8_9BACI|nr:hypothetical protein [Halobacillus locisalis]MBA2174598.1 hypothetical protein [Halobacillus locisalis]